MNDLMASGYGRIVANSIKISGDVAKFTLQSSRNRYFVTVAGCEQCAIVKSAATTDGAVFVVGRLFTFIHNGCSQHHCGLDAMFVLHADGNGAAFNQIEQQLVINQMRNNGKNTILA